MKLLFLLLLCVLILARSVQSPSFVVRLHGSLSIPIASFVERGLFIKTFCHRKYLNRRIVYSSGHQGTFNPGFAKSRPAAQRPAAHGPPRPSGPAARRPSGPRPTARDGPAARRPGGPVAHSSFSTVFLSSGKSTRMHRSASGLGVQNGRR